MAVGYIGAELESNTDQDLVDRRRMPQLFGYLPDEKRRRGVVLSGVFFYLAGFLATKWVAVAALASVSSVITALWLSVEFVVWLMLRNKIEGEAESDKTPPSHCAARNLLSKQFWRQS